MHMLLKNVYCYIQPRPYPTVSPRRQARISERRGSSSYPRWAFPFRFVFTFLDPFIKLPKWDAKGWLVRHFLFLCASSEHIILCTYFFAHLSLHIIHFAHDPFCISIHSARHPFCISSILHYLFCIIIHFAHHLFCIIIHFAHYLFCIIIHFAHHLFCIIIHAGGGVLTPWCPAHVKAVWGEDGRPSLKWEVKNQNAECKVQDMKYKLQNTKFKMQNAK